jgi:hypothetical protein
MLEPMRAKLLQLNDEPISKKSTTLKLEPILEIPQMDTEEPHRIKLLTDIELPKWKKSNALQADPMRVNP